MLQEKFTWRGQPCPSLHVRSWGQPQRQPQPQPWPQHQPRRGPGVAKCSARSQIPERKHQNVNCSLKKISWGCGGGGGVHAMLMIQLLASQKLVVSLLLLVSYCYWQHLLLMLVSLLLQASLLLLVNWNCRWDPCWRPICCFCTPIAAMLVLLL